MRITIFLTLCLLWSLNVRSQNYFETQFSVSFPNGDAREITSFNMSLDVDYMIPLKITKKDDGLVENKNIRLDVGPSVRYTHSVAKDNFKDLNFIPLAGIIRITYFKTFSFSFPVGYAISLDPEVSEGGAYFAPNFGIWGKKASLNVSYRMMNLDGFDYRTIAVGFGYRF